MEQKVCVHFSRVTYFSSAHFIHFFPQVPYTIPDYHVLKYVHYEYIYVDNEMYYFIIICLGDIIDYDAVQCLCTKE